jgi:hypothetical protein
VSVRADSLRRLRSSRRLGFRARRTAAGSRRRVHVHPFDGWRSQHSTADSSNDTAHVTLDHVIGVRIHASQRHLTFPKTTDSEPQAKLALWMAPLSAAAARVDVSRKTMPVIVFERGQRESQSPLTPVRHAEHQSAAPALKMEPMSGHDREGWPARRGPIGWRDCCRR